MTTRIIIARHGNTFTKEETPRRVGGRTDLPLVETERGTNIGRYLKAANLLPEHVFAAPLQRTTETARLAISAAGIDLPLQIIEDFREINYGPDENKTEDEVIARIGPDALDRWNKDAVVPDGWKVDPRQIIDTWIKWGQKVEQEFKHQNTLIVSSNGIIRFAPYLTGNFEHFSTEHNIKVGTGCICIFEKEEFDKQWKCAAWNLKPKDYLDK